MFSRHNASKISLMVNSKILWFKETAEAQIVGLENQPTASS